MSRDRHSEPRSGLEVVRIGGGASARLGALVVAGVLAAVVWVGVSNRPPTPASQRTANPAVALPTSAPAQTRGPTPTPAPNAFGVSATIRNHTYVAALEEIRPGYMFATLRVPIPPDAGSGLLTMTELWAADLWENPVAVGDWTMPLDTLFTGNRDPQLVIDAAMPARPNRDDVPLKVRGGFALKVYAENDLLFGLISIEVILNPSVTT